MQHILKLKRQNIGSQCKDVKVGVICEKWKEFVTIWATVFCTFCRRWIKYLGKIVKKLLKSLDGNEQKH